MSTAFDSGPSKQTDLGGVVEWRRNNLDLGKCPRYYYYRLESESSCSRASDDDTESIYSLQDKETDIAKDTSDTDSKSEDDYDVEIEFEVASSSESEHEVSHDSSSGSERAQQDVIFAVAAAAIANNIDEWITDCEDSDDNSTADETSFDRKDFSNCIQCYGRNDHPLYRYCEKCFQICSVCKKARTYKNLPLCSNCYKNRKKFLPPRPKRFRKSRMASQKTSTPIAVTQAAPVKLATLRHCLSGLSSQDSGLGSSQDCPSLDLDRIVVPSGSLTSPGTSKHLSEDDTHSEIETSDRGFDRNTLKIESNRSVSPSLLEMQSTERKSRKRQISESSLSDFEVKKPRITEDLSQKIESTSGTWLENKVASINDVSDDSFELPKRIATASSSDGGSSSNQSDLCIFCNNAPKDSIFLHTNMAHMCCCYACAKKTLNRIKRCPICNRPVNKIVKIYTC